MAINHFMSVTKFLNQPKLFNIVVRVRRTYFSCWLRCYSLAIPRMAHYGSSSQVNFESFNDGWLVRQQEFTDKLFLAISPENTDQQDYQILVDQVLAHYQQYFEEKSRATRDHVFLFFSPPWFNSFEKSFLWIGGYRPSLVFAVLNNSISDLTPDQRLEIDRLKLATIREERELGKSVAQLQESVATPTPMSVIRRHRDPIHGEIPQIDSAIAPIKSGMQAALYSADALRGTTVTRVLQLLLPEQKIKLLAAIGEFLLRVKRWGQLSEQLST